MSGLCASGHLSRLLSVIQGFDVKPELQVKIGIDDEVYATLKHKAETALQNDEDSDQIIDSMTADDKSRFIRFVKKVEPPRRYREFATLTKDWRQTRTSPRVPAWPWINTRRQLDISRASNLTPTLVPSSLK